MSDKMFGTRDMRQAVGAVCREVQEVLSKVDEQSVVKFVEAVETAVRVYTTGMGRSSLVARAFAMRLVHLGFRSHVVGETTATAVGKGDLLVAISGSGTTRTVIAQCEAALSAGSRVAGVTAVEGGPLHALAAGSAGVVLIPACLGVRHRAEGFVSTEQFGGSLFEQTAFLLLDALVQVLAAGKGKTEQDMISRHANLE